MRPLRFVLGITLLAACNSILGNKDFHFVKGDGDAGAGPVAQKCRLNTECPTGNVCLFEICGPRCAGDQDCDTGFRCLATEDGLGCVSSTAASCEAETTCPKGTACSATDGECRTKCDASTCLTGQTCTDGLCVSEPAHETGAGGSQGMSGAANAGGSGENTGGTTSASGSGGNGTGGSSAGANSGGAGAAGAGSGGAGSGGTSGAGAGGGGAGGMASLPCKTFTLCDGFEGDAPGTGTSLWNVQLDGYTVVVDSSQVHSGTKAVHVSAPIAPGSGWINETTTFPATDFWGRAWLRLNAVPYGHQVFIAIETQMPVYEFRLLNSIGNMSDIKLNDQNDSVFTSTATIPMQTWFCYEWHVTTNSTSVYVDGTQLTYLKDMNPTWTITNPHLLQLGFQRLSGGTSAGEIWIDDVAVNATRVGCQ